MDLFLSIHDRQCDEDLKVNSTFIRTYEVKDEKDRQGVVHKLIVYALISNIYLEEEFESDSDRDSKVEILEAYNA